MAPGSPLATIRSLDHIVLTVASIEQTVAFYAQLGMRHDVFSSPSAAPDDSKRHGLLFGSSKINLHELGHEYEPHAADPKPGSTDLCFIVEEDVELVRTRLGLAGFDVLEGDQVVRRSGARGPIKSVYVRDPDGNLIECVRRLDVSRQANKLLTAGCSSGSRTTSRQAESGHRPRASRRAAALLSPSLSQ